MNFGVGSLLLIGFAAVAAMMFGLWLIHLRIKNAGVVDVGWGLGFVLLSAIYACLCGGYMLRDILLVTMVALWGFRIVFFLIERLSSEEEDRRYQKIRKDWRTALAFKFFLFFEFQAVLQVVLSIPFLVAALNASEKIHVLEIAGIVIAMGGLVFETIADEQLKNFKRKPSNKGKTCQVGLWNYSRHPNYFFEWVIWVGFFVFGLGSPNGIYGIIAPVIVLFLVLKVSGIPMAEEMALQSRGEEYRRYQRSTSAFIPLPKKFKGA